MVGPTVSIITPAFNSGRFIRQTFESVLAQTFVDWEMIVVDDCSRDDTLDIARTYAERDGRIRWVRSPTNQGAGPSRNQALSMARGRYIAFLDADDLWFPEKLEKQLAFMKSHGCGFSFTSYRVVDEHGAPLGALGAVPPTATYLDLLKSNRIGCLTVMLDRRIVGDVRFPALRTNQDFALWLSLLKRGAVAYGLNEECATYRIVSTSNTRNKLKSARNVWRVYKAQGLPPAKLVWLYAHYALNGVMKHIVTGAYASQRRSGAAKGTPE